MHGTIRLGIFLFFASASAPAAIAPPQGSIHTNTIDRLLPNQYWMTILPDAKKFAVAKASAQKTVPATKKRVELKQLAQNSYFADLALFELAQLELNQAHDPVAARTHLQTIIVDFPNSPLVDRAKLQLSEAEFATGEKNYRRAKTQRGAARLKSLELASQALQRGLDRLSWKDWDENEASVGLLARIYKELQSPLFDGFFTEAMNALSENSRVRPEIADLIPQEQRAKLMKIAQHYGGGNGSKGTRSIQPDEELFKNAMDKILDTKWDEALDTLRTFKTAYPDSQENERVDYWLAVCLDAIGKKTEAEQAFEKIFHDYALSYYGLEAAMRSQQPLAAAISDTPLSVDKIDGNLLPQQLEYLWRARALMQVGLVDDARREMDALFRYSPGGMRFGQPGAKGSLALAMLFSENRYFPGAFFHLKAAFQKDPGLISRESLALYFPKAFAQDMEDSAKNLRIDPYFVFSIAKQESAFNPEANSTARALGLMQVLLSTAQGIQDSIDKKSLLDPKKNIRIGTEYMAKLLRQFDGNMAFALAGYNAGPARAKRWWRELEKRPIFKNGFRADAFIDSIPIKETRGYVGSILRNYAWYRYLNGQPSANSVTQLALGDFSAPVKSETIVGAEKENNDDAQN